MLRLFLFLWLSLAAFAQSGTEVNVSQGPPWTNWTRLLFRDGSSNNEYLCYALSKQPTFVWYAAGPSVTLTSIVDSANTATVTTVGNHGLLPGNIIIVEGVSTDTDLNGTYNIQTVGSPTTFTITTANVSDGTYNGSNNPLMNVNTTAPRTSAAIWSIMRMYYTSNLLDRSAWAGGDTATTKICDNRASLGYN